MAVVVQPAPTAPLTSTHPAGAAPAPRRRPLPPGQPRAWYESHNRRLKALRLATALLADGVYHPTQATDRRIRAMALRIGVNAPSDTTCRQVRVLMLH